MEHIFRIFDFNVYNQKVSSNDESASSDDETNKYKDSTTFVIQMFGVNEKGETCSIIAEDYRPFFYVMVNDSWTIKIKDDFLTHIKNKIGKYYENSITECIIIKRKKLYGFDGGKEHKFIKFEFASMSAFNKVKNLWYSDYQTGHTLLNDGYKFNNTNIRLYEANIPPLLRFFHIRDISPSGWVALPKKKTIELTGETKKTNCTYEYTINYKNIVPLNDMETRVPYKIMSFDIEASSSHGDFPVPVKTYKKLATNIVEYFENLKIDMTKELCATILKKIIFTAFGYEKMDQIDLVYPKKAPESKERLEQMCEKWLSSQVRNLSKSNEYTQANTLESLFEKMAGGEDEDEFEHGKFVKAYTDKKATIVDILCDKKFERDGKLSELNISLNANFPKLEGDKCTFIGSTFMNYGEQEPFMNHCIVLNTCTELPLENSIVESYNTEKEVLLAWQKLVQRENPDIIIGYNIFGFDYQFMFSRAEENNCIEDFLKLSRNKDEICATRDNESGKYKMEESSIQIASGQHDLRFIKMNGRLQVDLYNFYRREANLTSYKLDYVAGNFIGDFIKNLEYNAGETEIKTGNMTGLLVGSYVHFEEIGHSVDYYDDGAKFLVTYVNKKDGKFKIEGNVNPDLNKKVRWCLAKDDVTPKDIFRMTNGTANDRAVIAKYCIQDCNLVHYLFNKSDILTGFIEMAKICSVPINFLVMRGQGIKLTSFVSKKCREKRTLMPVIEKGGLDEGYEGAIVLEPKCDLYLDNPVACNDYASLYPSSMISENLSHDSKVWTKEYNLDGNLIEEWGEKDENGNYIYDNLPGYEYVNCTYDTYRYVRKTPTSAAEKVKAGHKICRFVQPNDSGEGEAIMPSILKELLKARKDTRKMIPQQSDEFMKNVLDQRQLGYKVTANSLYGQCGAKTSTFYEKDIAACTTATGRLLLTYGKKMIEECYGDNICNTEHYGKVKTRAEYIYGDTDSVFYTFNLEDLDGNPIRGKKALEITIELAQQVGDISAKFLKGPHDFEYEKTFMPFCLLSKKRYVGMLYETDPNKCKRKEMGIVLKRRDNAPIVKDIYGGIIDILMKQQNIKQAIDFLKGCLQNIVEEKYSVDKLIITKSLRSGYKNPQSIAHKVLADRITARDPGNKPSSGDRIPFVYINSSNKKALQGEKIETPTFIAENNLKIDYSFYITNQIMKPVQQLFALVLEKIWEMQNKKPKIAKFKKDVELLRKNTDPDKFEDKLEQLRNKEVKILLFDEYLRETNNEKLGVQSLTKLNFFTKK
jgi:DNA polymerase elongation subunit (family B)